MSIHRKRYLIPAIVITVVPSYFCGGLLATTKSRVTLTCPVCSGKVEGYVISSTNTFGGQDRDFLTRAAGDQPVLVVPTTCPRCFYSGYTNDFASQADVSEVAKEQILHKKVLKPMIQIEEGVQSHEIPAYVRYDLIAQTYQLRGKTDEVIAQQFLNASWAARMESDLPSTVLGEGLTRKIREWATRQSDGKETLNRGNTVLYRIQKGKEYAEAAQSLQGETRLITAVVAIDTLRMYGENTEAQKVLPILRTVMSALQCDAYGQFLNDSIAREQGFQSKALPLFERVIQTEENAKKKAALTYLCGELCRRLGHWDKAAHYYDQCLEIEGHPAWLGEWVKEQKSLLPDREARPATD